MIEPVVDVADAVKFMKEESGVKVMHAGHVPGVMQAGYEERTAECVLVGSCYGKTARLVSRRREGPYIGSTGGTDQSKAWKPFRFIRFEVPKW